MPRLPATLVSDLSRAFANAADATVALGQKKYMRNQFNFWGLSKPVRAGLQNTVFKKHVVKEEQDLSDTISLLWDKDQREFKYAAIDLAFKYKKLWTPAMLGVFEKMIRTQSWWDTVDAISAKLVGGLIQQFPTDLMPHMEKWITDAESFWIQRCALIFQLSYKDETNEDMLFRFCAIRMKDSEFFIRKAIGWSLRQYSKNNPSAVRRFIEANSEELSPLSKREGSKYI